ncbi:MAG: hypothetical protein WBO35_04280 [Candidatus Saccharimonadales bacterium]
MKHLRENTGAVMLSRRLQLSLIWLAVGVWLANTLMPLVIAFRNHDGLASNYLWFWLWTQFGLPLVCLAIALIYATRHYRGRLHQTFVAVFLTTLGLMLYTVLQTILTTYRYGIVTPKMYLQEPTLWEQIGGDAILTVLFLIVYTVLIWHHDWRLYRTK